MCSLTTWDKIPQNLRYTHLSKANLYPKLGIFNTISKISQMLLCNIITTNVPLSIIRGKRNKAPNTILYEADTFYPLHPGCYPMHDQQTRWATTKAFPYMARQRYLLGMSNRIRVCTWFLRGTQLLAPIIQSLNTQFSCLNHSLFSPLFSSLAWLWMAKPLPKKMYKATTNKSK